MDAPGYLYTIATVGMSFAGLSVLTMILRQMLGGQVSRLLCAFLLGLATRSVTADTPDDPQLQQHALGAEVFAAHWTFTNTPGAAKFRASSPLFNVNSCSTCHPGGGSGIGPAGNGAAPEALEIQLATPAATESNTAGERDPPGDPVYGHVFNTSAANGLAPEGTVLVHYSEKVGYYYPDGTRWHLRRPTYELTQLTRGPLAAKTVIKPRLAPQLRGAGLLELATPEAGFGWQGSSRDIREQTAKAFSREMGVSSPDMPRDDCTAAEADCLQQHNLSAPGVSADQFAGVVEFVRAFPPPTPATQPDDTSLGSQLFTSAGCPKCHLPALSILTVAADGRAATTSISPYTDLELHDLGKEMADQDASGRTVASRWRTAPLWGMSYRAGPTASATLLHDGRARSIEEAILWHGGEADFSRANFAHLGPRSRKALLEWVSTL